MRARARLLRFWSSDQEGDDGVRRNFASLIRGIFLCDLTGLLRDRRAPPEVRTCLGCARWTWSSPSSATLRSSRAKVQAMKNKKGQQRLVGSVSRYRGHDVKTGFTVVSSFSHVLKLTTFRGATRLHGNIDDSDSSSSTIHKRPFLATKREPSPYPHPRCFDKLSRLPSSFRTVQANHGKASRLERRFDRFFSRETGIDGAATAEGQG
ncbi:hypothetical protein NL676_016315 [Syzygium grande]|nr:hypothetical protein NL676_016315 [Syzygium grande]